MLVAVGRRPNSKIPGLETTKVKVDAKGFIETDDAAADRRADIFAIGDVAGEPMLAHKASHEARVAVEAIAGHKAVFEPQAIPAVVFTDPEIAWCGLTEAQAQADGHRVEVARFPWGALGRAITVDRPEGLTKLVLEPKTGRILGVGIVGSGAGELIAEGVLAIEMGATAEDLQADHPPASDAVGDADGERRSVLRAEHARVQAEEEVGVSLAGGSGSVVSTFADGARRVAVCRVLRGALSGLRGSITSRHSWRSWSPDVGARGVTGCAHRSASEAHRVARGGGGHRVGKASQPVCAARSALATPPAPRGGGAGPWRRRAARRRPRGGAPAGPARETWYAEPQKVFDNLYFVGRPSTRPGRSRRRRASS